MLKYFPILLLLFGFLVTAPASLSAQSGNYEQISWDDSDEDEDDEEAEDLTRYKQADVYVKDELMELSPEMELEYAKNDTFMIKVRHLRPSSFVFVNLQKAGMKLEKKNYRANEKGELDLEVRTGKRRVKGSAVLKYTAGNNEKQEIKVKLAVR